MSVKAAGELLTRLCSNSPLPPRLNFSLFTKMVVLKTVHSIKVCQSTKFHGPTLTGTSFAYTLEV